VRRNTTGRCAAEMLKERIGQKITRANLLYTFKKEVSKKKREVTPEDLT